MISRLSVSVWLLTIALGANSEVLIKTTTSWDGGPIAYPEGQAEITVLHLSLLEGRWVPFHCHPVPTVGYVLSGSIRVQRSSGEEIIVGPGESVVEVMRTLHRGQGFGGDAEIIVVYAGATDLPTTFEEGTAGATEHCKETGR